MIRRSFLGSLAASIVAGATAIRAKAKTVAVPHAAPATIMTMTFDKVTPTIDQFEIEGILDHHPIGLIRSTRGSVNTSDFLGHRPGTVKFVGGRTRPVSVGSSSRVVVRYTFQVNRGGWNAEVPNHREAQFGLLPLR